MPVTPIHLKPLPRKNANHGAESFLNLNNFCNNNPVSTYFMRVDGDSMMGAGIYHDDVLLVDRSVSPHNGDIVVASLPSGFTVKELSTSPTLSLIPHNPKYKTLYITNPLEFEVFGVVVSVVRTLK